MRDHTACHNGGRWTFTLLAACIVTTAVSASRLAAQITLPSLRATGPSPEIRLLLTKIELARQVLAFDTMKTDGRRLVAARDRMLARFAEAPLTPAMHQALASARSSDDSLVAFAGLLPGREDQQTLARVKRIVDGAKAPRAFVADTGAIGQTVLQQGSSVPPWTEVSEFETGSLADDILQHDNDVVRRAFVDSLSRLARLVVIERKLTNRIWSPVRSREQAQVFWRQPGFSTLNVGTISGGGGHGAAFTEIASPFLHAWRMSINAVVAATPGDKKSDSGSNSSSAPSGTALTRFLNGGGLLNVTMAYPLAHLGFPNGTGDFMALYVPRLGATLPALGAGSTDTTLSLDNGLELHFKTVDLADGVGLFTQSRFGVASGTKQFASSLGLPADRRMLRYLTWSAGFYLGGRYLITGTRVVSGPPSLQHLSWQMGVTVVGTGSAP